MAGYALPRGDFHPTNRAKFLGAREMGDPIRPIRFGEIYSGISRKLKVGSFVNARLAKLVEKLSKVLGITETELKKFESASCIRLPEQYAEFMKVTNGGEGHIGKNSYVQLFPLQDLMSINQAAATNRFAPGLFIFGSNGMGDILRIRYS
jgi:hypothetical protein